MSRLSAWLWMGFLMVSPLLGLVAQENGARAAADREVAEERYRRLNSAVEDLTASQLDLRKRIEQLAEAVQRVGTEARAKPAENTFVTREEFNKLVETVREVDRKRDADKRLIMEKIESLGESLSASIRDAVRRPAPAETPRTTTKPEVKPDAHPEEAAAAPTTGAQEGVGVWYVIEKDNTLTAIVKAHNDQFKSQGRKTTLKLVQEANPKLKANSLSVGQKIFIPLVKIEGH